MQTSGWIDGYRIDYQTGAYEWDSNSWLPPVLLTGAPGIGVARLYFDVEVPPPAGGGLIWPWIPRQPYIDLNPDVNIEAIKKQLDTQRIIVTWNDETLKVIRIIGYQDVDADTDTDEATTLVDIKTAAESISDAVSADPGNNIEAINAALAAIQQAADAISNAVASSGDINSNLTEINNAVSGGGDINTNLSEINTSLGAAGHINTSLGEIKTETENVAESVEISAQES